MFCAIAAAAFALAVRGLPSASRAAHPLARGGALRGGRLAPAAVRMVSTVAAPDDVAVVVDDITRPALDHRQYRYIELGSGLRALLISDPRTDKAAAALEVQAGHFDDPEGVAGLAHFTEHMMFLGTESYPDEQAFKDFITRYGGSSNAFTGMESTGYHFGVNALQLAPALDRFASFFREPLLREDSARREMQAVHSEFQRNLQSDQRRLFQLIKSTSDTRHPFHKFSTGSLETLSNLESLGYSSPHLAVRAFYQSHYTPPKMTLAVLGKQSLAELTALVTTAFGSLGGGGSIPVGSPALGTSALGRAGGGGIPVGGAGESAAAGGGATWGAPDGPAAMGASSAGVRGVGRSPAPTAVAPAGIDARLDSAPPAGMDARLDPGTGSGAGPLSSAQVGGLLRMTPVRESRLLRLLWQAEPDIEYVASRAPRLVSHLLSGETEGSLSWLLTKGSTPALATSVTASTAYSMSDASVFAVSISLTPEGAERYEEVASLVHGALNLLRDTIESHADSGGLPPHLLKERVTMSKLGFEYGDEADPLGIVKAMASRMHMPGLPPSDLLSRPYAWGSSAASDPSPLRSFLSLLTPHRALTLLVAPGVEAPFTERWYGTAYNLNPIPPATLDAWAAAAPHPLLRLPPPNPYVPDTFELIAPEPRTGGESQHEVASPSPLRRRSPTLLQERPGLRCWHLGIGSFARPKASALVLVRSPHASGCSKSVVLSTLLMELVEDQLATTLAAAPDAGAGWAMGVHAGGLVFQASGYSQRVPDLSLALAQAFAAFEPDRDRFTLHRQLLVKGLRNRREERPLWQAQYELSHALTEPVTHYEEALAFAEDEAACSLQALQQHLQLLRSSGAFIETFLHGNSSPGAAVALADGWTSALDSPAIAVADAPLPRAVAPRIAATLPRAMGAAERCWDTGGGGAADAGGAGADALRMRCVISNSDETNSGCEVHLHVGADLDARTEAMLRLTSAVAAKDAFHVLRTVRQLGYVVSCGVRSVGDARGLSVLVQSAVASPTSLEYQMEEWLSDFRANTFPALPPASLADTAASLATNLEEPPRSLGQEAGPVWAEIVEGTHRWQRDLEVAAQVRSLTKEDLLAFWDDHLAAGAPRRQKVVSSCFSHADARAEGLPIPEPKPRPPPPPPRGAQEIGVGEVTDT